jgi:hypothetical protein
MMNPAQLMWVTFASLQPGRQLNSLGGREESARARKTRLDGAQATR